MAKATVPILKGLRTEGGTMYTLSSSMNDAILLFSNTNIQMNFSKFACLKLPQWANVTTQRIYRDPNDLKSTNDTPASDDPNTFFPKAYIQNYMENFLSHVDEVRTDNDFSNFSEASFWKAMQSVADSDNNTATDGDNTLQLTNDVTYIDPTGSTRQKFKEKSVSSSYSPLIQFVGDINMVNHKKHQGKEYLEVFAHIANSQGRVDGTLLKPNDNLTGQVSTAQVPTTSGTDYIAGQQTAYTSAPASDKSYAKAVYDTADKKYNVTGDKDFLQIDWDDLSATSSQSKYNKGNFDFNCILLYYDIQEKDKPATKRRNLYGILVLDKMTSISAVTHQINSQKKYQPNANQAGNAFGFLFNLMFSNNTNQITSTITINDTAVVAMQMYQKAMSKLQEVMIKYDGYEKIMLGMQNDVTQLKAQMLGLQNRIISDSAFNTLKSQVNTNTTNISTNSTNIQSNKTKIDTNHP
ncbi:hypothetical protein HYO65_gp171 [Tenacibaculum phage PTm1]|uniref:Uncharacterized protein n=2 Tax=Shirahamavirus PTm1 TaxID=2846435 RepID=A0A5S9C126_9CAUD|nr:hypothetical protein HYO65_gp171 [Tenacibaculum phage PTm1]BBI90563.1 hypothetical protein [Tenacibaculum phage PTm1]BBI90871.1 hypothetical protein [Tenacibaculum phage PTm5]